MTNEVQRLSEGMDFIEEECGFSEGLIFEAADEVIISESDQKKSPFKIIGVVKGIIQPIGELSRNKRLYPQSFWPDILSTPIIQERIASRDMLGCISHSDKKVDCADLKSGEVSHIVTCLEVRENAEGTPFLYGEMEILDTPAGRIIKALYEGGANIYVSTRGAGKLRDIPGQPYKEVDSSSYFLETVDFVRRPGFLKAKPVYEGVKNSEVSEATNMEKVLDLDHKINNAEEISEVSKELKEKAFYERTQRHNKAYDELDDKIEAAHKAGDKEKRNELMDKQDKELDKYEKKMDLYSKSASHESEVAELKGQIDQLTKIIEKVVNDVYETPESKVGMSESFETFVKLMADTNISEEAFCEVLELIMGDRK